MQKDLMRFFGVTARVVKRKIKSKGGKPRTNFGYINNDSVLYIYNQTFDRLLSWLSYVPIEYNLATPFINKTKYKENVEFKIKVDPNETPKIDLVTLKKELRFYGLELREEYYTTDFLIISDEVKKQE